MFNVLLNLLGKTSAVLILTLAAARILKALKHVNQMLRLQANVRRRFMLGQLQGSATTRFLTPRPTLHLYCVMMR